MGASGRGSVCQQRPSRRRAASRAAAAGSPPGRRWVPKPGSGLRAALPLSCCAGGPYHGKGGPLAVENPRYQHYLHDEWWAGRAPRGPASPRHACIVAHVLPPIVAGAHLLSALLLGPPCAHALPSLMWTGSPYLLHMLLRPQVQGRCPDRAARQRRLQRLEPRAGGRAAAGGAAGGALVGVM